ncbi:MAG: LacI family DNA-binding transcriptional regulator [Candidatus Omnitrophica bacterium]|nr:LacI family DNA-binding transcriptional regulator [Candidatus Omnitrophota bacterium]
MTIYDIAKKAGVSSATISRVLNHGPVKPSTKERVLKIIEKENFFPDSSGVYLKKLKTKKIGLVIPDISNPVYPVTVRIIHDFLKKRGYHLIFGNTYGEVSEEKDVLEMMSRERVAGIIVATCEGEDDTSLYPMFRRMSENMSIIFLGEKRDSLMVDAFTVDSLKGMYKITRYLLNTGKRNIGFIAGSKSLRATEERLQGYQRALKERDVAFNPDNVICEGLYNIDYGKKWGKILLEKGVDAVVCGNDLLAVGVIKAAEKMNIKIPDDVAVTGFDDIFLGSLVKPALTTVRQPVDIVKSGCECLIERIEGRKTGEPEEILFEPEIVIRESA